MKTITTMLILSNLLDAITTYYGLKVGLKEGNELVNKIGWKWANFMKVFGVLLGIVCLELLSSVWINLFWIVNIGIFFIAFRNAYFITRRLLMIRENFDIILE